MRSTRTLLIAPILAESLDQAGPLLRAAAGGGADLAEWRLDFLADAPTPGQLADVIRSSPLPVLATCRPVRQGGRYADDEAARLDILRAAAVGGAAYVDVELDCDLARILPEVRAAGTCRTIVSEHDFQGVPADPASPSGLRRASLPALVRRLSAAGADIIKIAFTAAGPEDGVRALQLIALAGRPMIALAMGEAGLISRVLAGKFGAFGTFASLAAGQESAPGQPTLDQFRRLYRWNAVGADTGVYGAIGCPIAHSMSPAVHNAAFAHAGLDAVYLPFRVEPGPEPFNRFLRAALDEPALNLRGLSVTIPHKENALAFVGRDRVDALSARIGAINTIAIDADGLRGTNTDYAGAMAALCAALEIRPDQLAQKSVAVLGAGGAARAIVAALSHYGAHVTIYNRTAERARALAEEFQVQAAPLVALSQVPCRIVINCTSVGMHPRVEESPLPDGALAGVELVFDTIYNPLRTRLLQQAELAGCRTVSGLEMFVHQAAAQFEIWTGQPAPADLMRQVVQDHLKGRSE